MKINTPRQGIIDGWRLAHDTDIVKMAVNEQGTLCVAVSDDDNKHCIYVSQDDGCSWGNYGTITGPVVDLRASNDTIVYTNGDHVFVTQEPINGFVTVPDIPVESGNQNIEITSLDVYVTEDGINIMAATRDHDDDEFGAVYVLNNALHDGEWVNTGLAGKDICKVLLSENYGADGIIWAVSTDEHDAVVSVKRGDVPWMDYSSDAFHGIVPAMADMVVSKTDADTLYIGIHGMQSPGDVFRVHIEDNECSVEDMDVGIIAGFADIDVSCVETGFKDGFEYLYAGTDLSGDVFRSCDGGENWVTAYKRPSGRQITGIQVDAAFGTSGRVYAVSSGPGSAFSVSEDRGVTYDQYSLIDTDIPPGSIVYIGISPVYETDTTLYFVSFDSIHFEYNMWRSTDGGSSWVRIISGGQNGMDRIRYMVLSPEYGSSGSVLYMSGMFGTDPVLWRSADRGQTFTRFSLPSEADALTVLDNDTVFITCYDGDVSRIYRTDDGGDTWDTGVIVGTSMITDIRISPDFSYDGAILAGGAGWVYYSEDAGSSFLPVTLDSSLPSFDGFVTVAFDTRFSENHMIYAGSSTADEGIYRFVLGGNSDWQHIDARLPEDGRIVDIEVSDNGVLYALNGDSVDAGGSGGGVERSINPSYHLSPTFQTVDKGLEDGIHLDHLIVTGGNRLWSVDNYDNWILTYVDTMVHPVTLKYPDDEYPGMNTGNCVLDWNAVPGATEYEWQVDYTGYFSTVPDGFQGYTSGSSVRLSLLESDTEYHWRVRVTKPVSSSWSELRTFTTTLGQPLVCPSLLSPGAGAELTSKQPVFQWSAIAGAEKYELLVSNDIVFSEPVIEKAGNTALPVTAWQSDVILDEASTYYWKVRALSSETNTDWSAVSAFVIPSGEAEEPDQTPAVMTVYPVVPDLLSPSAGAEDTPLQPLFQWEAVQHADCYELIVAADPLFENPVIYRGGEYTLPVTAWRSTESLEPGAVYYWKTRALVAGVYTEWSTTGIFSVEPGQQVPESTAAVADAKESVVPVIIQQPVTDTGQDIPLWMIYTGFGLLVTMVILQIAVLLVVIVTRANRT